MQPVLKCFSAYVTAKLARAHVVAMVAVTAAVGVLRPTAVVTVAAMVADRARAAKVQTVVTVPIAHRAKTAAASFSRQVTGPMPTRPARLRVRAAVVAWGNPPDFQANRVHPVHLPASLIPCVPASI